MTLWLKSIWAAFFLILAIFVFITSGCVEKTPEGKIVIDPSSVSQVAETKVYVCSDEREVSDPVLCETTTETAATTPTPTTTPPPPYPKEEEISLSGTMSVNKQIDDFKVKLSVNNWDFWGFESSKLEIFDSDNTGRYQTVAEGDRGAMYIKSKYNDALEIRDVSFVQDGKSVKITFKLLFYSNPFEETSGAVTSTYPLEKTVGFGPQQTSSISQLGDFKVKFLIDNGNFYEFQTTELQFYNEDIKDYVTVGDGDREGITIKSKYADSIEISNFKARRDPTPHVNPTQSGTAIINFDLMLYSDPFE